MPNRDQAILSTAPYVQKMKKNLQDFRKQDYLLAVGDPVIIGISTAAVSEVTTGQFNILKWDKREFRYYPLEVDMYQKGIIMSVKNKIKIKTFTGSGSFDIKDEMINDSKDFLDTIEVTTIAQECVNLKKVEDEIAAIEEQLKKKKDEHDHISSKVIPELLAEQGLSEIKLADGSKVSVKKEFRCTLPKDEAKREQAYEWLRNEKLGDIIKKQCFCNFW